MAVGKDEEEPLFFKRDAIREEQIKETPISRSRSSHTLNNIHVEE